MSKLLSDVGLGHNPHFCHLGVENIVQASCVVDHLHAEKIESFDAHSPAYVSPDLAARFLVGRKLWSLRNSPNCVESSQKRLLIDSVLSEMIKSLASCIKRATAARKSARLKRYRGNRGKSPFRALLPLPAGRTTKDHRNGLIK
jgi:hypothetical protein